MGCDVYQMVPMTCSYCGQGGVQPREEVSIDRYSRTKITEATWICYNCGNRFNSGVVSRESLDDK